MSLGEIAAEPGADVKIARRARARDLRPKAGSTSTHQVYPYGSHAAVVRVDRETGGVTIERYVIGYDIGRAINPIAGEGADRRRVHARHWAARCWRNSPTASAAIRCASRSRTT